MLAPQLESTLHLANNALILWFFLIDYKCKKVILTKVLRHPGFEPGSTAWKAAILTTRLIARCC